ncbi:1486_t:CDS:2 [Funneliformis caledonium]|uniref:1486_t:CDS:1 n=1 Tax=Funneliformis caledonium TaxID=1117310 RepID=A0A9N8VSN2_9GLOM|nr:1486_t:CDS:2 [Funneliformis caledonium]
MNEYCLGYKNSSIHNAILSTHSNSLKHLGFCVINDNSSLMGLISKCKNLEMLEVTQQENHEKTIRRGLHASRKSHQALLPSYITKDIMDTMERHNSGLTRLNISMRSNHILDLIHLIGGWKCAKVGFDAYSSRRFGLLKGLVGHFNHLRKVKSKKGIPGLNGLVEQDFTVETGDLGVCETMSKNFPDESNKDGNDKYYVPMNTTATNFS